MGAEVVYHKQEVSEAGLEEALVVKTNGAFKSLENETLFLAALKQTGLTLDELASLTDGRFIKTTQPINKELSFGDIKEYVTVHTTQIGDRQFEVAYCERRESLTTPIDFELQRRQPEPSYKILVCLVGKAVLNLPQTTFPTDAGYIATQEEENIPFRSGTIAIIKAPTAWSIGSSKAGLHYVYISFPPHNNSRDLTAYNPQI